MEASHRLTLTGKESTIKNIQGYSTGFGIQSGLPWDVTFMTQAWEVCVCMTAWGELEKTWRQIIQSNLLELGELPI